MTKFVAKEDVERNWWIIDAADKPLGRIATHIAVLLRGKHKPTFTPNVDNGDFVVVINADQVKLSGSKWTDKKYYRHSRFFGSLKEKTAEQMREDDPSFMVLDSVKGMLPENKLAHQLLTKLKVYKGADHPHKNQKPQPWKTN